MKTTKQPIDRPVEFTLELSEHEMLVIADALYRLPGGNRTFLALAPEVRAAAEALTRDERQLIPIRTQEKPIPPMIVDILRRGTR